MKIKITILPSNLKKEVEITKDSTVSDLLKKMNIKPDTVIVLVDKKPVPIDDLIGDVQELELLQVASGG
ncbi:MAG: MoaD/ThiS family protein [Candidatus Thermoplasmatota archaeon]